MSFIEKNGLKISSILIDFVNTEIIPGTDIQAEKFWDSFEKTVHELAPINKKLIETNIIKKNEININLLSFICLKFIINILNLYIFLIKMFIN